MLLFGLGGPVLSSPGGVHRIRGPGSIATARSAWSYRGAGLGGGERTGTGEVEGDVDGREREGSDQEEDEDECEKPRRNGTGDDLTPTEEITFDLVAPSPTTSDAAVPLTPVAMSPEDIALPETPVESKSLLPAV